jgi:hypothetical protein
MSAWMRLEPDNLDRQKKNASHNRINIEVSLSPYDIPEAVRGFESNGSFVIEFRYLGDEQTEIKASQNGDEVKFEVGKNSGRLYRIHLDLTRIKKTMPASLPSTRPQVAKRISDALSSWANSESTFTSKGRLGLAREIVSQNSGVLLNDLNWLSSGSAR